MYVKLLQVYKLGVRNNYKCNYNLVTTYRFSVWFALHL